MSTTSATRPAYRVWFRVDGIVTGLNAVAYLALHQLLPGVLGSTAALYLAVGIILAVVTVGLLVVAWSVSRPRVLPELLATINVIWAAGSFLIAIVNPFALTALGIVWTIAQGVIVLAFAIVQFGALKIGRDHARQR